MDWITGPRSNARANTKYTQLNVQTSAQNVPIPMVWGKKRMGANLIWYGDFTSKPAGKKGSGGGKGGEGKGSGSYFYWVAVMLGLCDGPISGIGEVWQDKTVTDLATLGLTLFTGTATQSPWSYLVTNHPTQALSYAYTAYLANSYYSLGRSPNLPNHQFEIITPLSGSMPGTVDVNMADVISDMLTNPQYSIGLSSSSINSTDLAFYKTYCQAAGLFFSPDVTSQEQAAQVIDRWAQLTNSWIFWSGSQLRFVPLGDTAITANGVTYTPVTAVRFNFTYDDFITASGSPPLTVTRADPADAPNHVRLEIKDRSNDYDAATAEWMDQALRDQYGIVDAPVTTAHEVCDTTIGQAVAQLIGLRYAYIRNTYSFKVGWIACVLEPGDIVTVTEPHVGLTNFPVRIRTLSEDDKGNWSIVAEELPEAIGTAQGTQRPQTTTNSAPNPLVSPGNVNPPAIFEPDSSLTNGVAQVWVAASGGANWGGAIVNMSFDGGTTYSEVGVITAGSAQGTLTADLPNHTDPDTTDTLAVDTTESDIVMPIDASHGDADTFRTLCLLTAAYTTTAPANGEIVSYGSVTAGSGTFNSNLTYLRRGLYNTPIADHPIGSFFTRVNLNGLGFSVVTYDMPPQYIGATIHVKLQSFNRFGNATQDISTVTAYVYTPAGAGYGGGTAGAPTAPTGLAAVPGYQQVALNWSANPGSDNVDAYKVYRALGLSQPFGSAVLVSTIGGLNYTDTGLAANQGYTYFLVATNAAGNSPASAAVNATTSATPIAEYRLQGFFPGKPPAGQKLIVIEMKGGEQFASALPQSEGGCQVAPTSNVTFTLYRNGISIGTMSIVAAATAATFSFASTVTFSAGDILEFDAPTPQDSTMSTPYYTLIGTR